MADTTLAAVPARRKAVFGNLGTDGFILDCGEISESVKIAGRTWLYVGCTDGYAVYRTAEDLVELQRELGNPPPAR